MKTTSLFALGLLYLSTGMAQVDLTSDLKVCMPFNGNALDGSGNGNHGTVNGAVSLTTDRFGNANSAYIFTGGTADNISINNFGSFIPTDELTIAMWGQSNAHTSTCLFQLDPDDANDRCVGCAQYLGVGLIWDYGDIFLGGRLTQGTSYDQQWHHYVYVISQTGNLQEIYMDGVLQNSGPYVMTLNNRSLPLLIGAGTSAIGGGSLRWRGKIDDVCIYNRALNSAEVLALKSQRSGCCNDQTTGDGLRVCMPFNGDAFDHSGHANHGTVNGAVSLTPDRFGVPNSAYYFTGGTADNITINNFGSFIPNDELTVSMWAASDLQTSTCLFQLDPDNASDRCVGCAQYLGMGLIWDYGDIASGGRMTQSTSYDQQWHHYVYIISQSGNRQEIYMDGTPQNTGPYVMTLSNRNLPFLIGAGTSSGGGGSLRWRGQIDDVCIFNRALSPSEVLAMFQANGPCCEEHDDPDGGGDDPDGKNATGLSSLIKTGKNLYYPSVSNNGIYKFRGDHTALQQVDVRSVDGKLVMSFDKSRISSNSFLDLSPLSYGIYYVTSTDKTGTSTQKLVYVK